MVRGFALAFLEGPAVYYAILAGVRKLPRRDADYALEAVGELALVGLGEATTNARAGPSPVAATT
jgi:hypothetical protein